MAKDLSEMIEGFMTELREKHLSMENVRKCITEEYDYQPHLIAPVKGYFLEHYQRSSQGHC